MWINIALILLGFGLGTLSGIKVADEDYSDGYEDGYRDAEMKAANETAKRKIEEMIHEHEVRKK